MYDAKPRTQTQDTLVRSDQYPAVITVLYNNQISAHAPIGQSALGYCYYKPTEKIARPPNYYIKAIDHKFLWFIS